MGGRGSGGHSRLSDEEKKARGTFEKKQSQDVYDDRKVVQLLQHPRMDVVPDAGMPLGERGSLKYRELAEMLLKANQLTIITKDYAVSAALAYESIYLLREQGKVVPASFLNQLNRALSQIQQFDIDKPVNTADGQKKNKFARAGFASRRS